MLSLRVPLVAITRFALHLIIVQTALAFAPVLPSSASDFDPDAQMPNLYYAW